VGGRRATQEAPGRLDMRSGNRAVVPGSGAATAPAPWSARGWPCRTAEDQHGDPTSRFPDHGRIPPRAGLASARQRTRSRPEGDRRSDANKVCQLERIVHITVPEAPLNAPRRVGPPRAGHFGLREHVDKTDGDYRPQPGHPANAAAVRCIAPDRARTPRRDQALRRSCSRRGTKAFTQRVGWAIVEQATVGGR
jgi:hypothetical protein